MENGRLIITAREDSLGGMSYSSAKITSLGKGDFRYGRFEASMKLPLTQGMWPAFWLLPTDKVDGEWPESGEMDVMEMIGKNPEQVFGTIQTGFPYTFNCQRMGQYGLGFHRAAGDIGSQRPGTGHILPAPAGKGDSLRQGH